MGKSIKNTNKNNLLKISLIISLIGILHLILFANIIEPKQIPISNITQEYLNKEIQIQGKILTTTEYDNFQILILKENSSTIKIKIQHPINTTNNNLIIKGKVIQYNNELQIQANKIIEIKN